jgi:4-amino-4-deoxy-L-arabinose transferase-like glycosyltransferase
MEPHPPAYYAMMLAWVKLFGTDIVTLRLPSVLFGIASIFLIYLLGSCEEGKATGLLAAAMLALNGLHIFWSQAARMYAPACFLGLLSSVLLLRISRSGTRPLGSLAVYCASTLTGLATVIFYWPIFVTQILWVAGQMRRQAAMAQLLCWQLWVFILATPLCTVAIHASRRPSYVQEEGASFLGRFFQFGFLFEPDVRSSVGPLATAATLGLAVVALLLMGVGLVSRSEPKTGNPGLPWPPRRLMACSALAGVAVILLFSGRVHNWFLAITGLMPLALAVMDILVRRHFLRIQSCLLHVSMCLPSSLLSLSGLLAVMPVMMVFAVSQAVNLFVARGLLLATPYLLVISARGFVTLVRRDLRWLALGLVLAVAHIWSVYNAYHLHTSPRDYKGLAEKLASRVQESDLIFILEKNWVYTPLFYYLKADRYHFVGKHYSEETRNQPFARVWVVTWENRVTPTEMLDALQSYAPGEQIDAFGANATLYTKGARAGVPLGQRFARPPKPMGSSRARQRRGTGREIGRGGAVGVTHDADWRPSAESFLRATSTRWLCVPKVSGW